MKPTLEKGFQMKVKSIFSSILSVYLLSTLFFTAQAFAGAPLKCEVKATWAKVVSLYCPKGMSPREVFKSLESLKPQYLRNEVVVMLAFNDASHTPRSYEENKTVMESKYETTNIVTAWFWAHKAPEVLCWKKGKFKECPELAH